MNFVNGYRVPCAEPDAGEDDWLDVVVLQMKSRNFDGGTVVRVDRRR